MAANDNNETEDRETRSERIFIPTPNRQGGPILDGYGYQRFAGSTFVVWFLFVGFLWYFEFDLQASKEVLTSIASASVEIAGLSLAVLGVLHEFNKQDRWFKLGLFLVSILFGYVVLSGFLIVLTWQPEFDAIQHVTLIIVFFIAFAAILQTDWYTLLETRLKPKGLKIPKLRKLRIRNVRLSIPFILPFFLIILPNANRLTSTLVLFCGAIIALLCLMGITTYSLIRNPKPQEEDPLVRLSREKAIAEEQVTKKAELLNGKILTTLSYLQEEQQKNISLSDAAHLIGEDAIINRLRLQDVLEPRETIHRAIQRLVGLGQVYSDSYSGPYWVVPNKDTVKDTLEKLRQLAFVVTHLGTQNKKSDTFIDGYCVANLKNWLSAQARIPEQVIREYIMPKALHFLVSNFFTMKLNLQKGIVFLNSTWLCSADDWHKTLMDGIATATKDWIDNHYYHEDKLRPFHTMDGVSFRRKIRGTIRFLQDNKLFGTMMDDENYQRVLHIAVLRNLPMVDDGFSSTFYHDDNSLRDLDLEKAQYIISELCPSYQRILQEIHSQFI